MKRFRPLWVNNRIENEILVFVRRGKEVSANLTFDRPWGLRLTDRRGTVLRECVDFKTDGRKVIALNDSIEYFEESWLNNENVPEFVENENERYKISGCLLVKPEYLRKKQYLASYYHEPHFLNGVFPDRITLPETYRKIKAGKELKLALMGDSISNAANSSYEMGVKGFRHWLDDALAVIRKNLGVNAYFENISKSGYGTEWALSVVDEKFKNADIDLAIIAFGMNDGAAGTSATDFKNNVAELINRIRRYNPETEFIIVSTPLPNKASKETFKTQPEYYREIKKLASEGIAIIDMAEISRFFLDRKTFIEISGNNLNHPNDFFYKFYSDIFAELFTRLIEERENRLDWSEYLIKPQFKKTSTKGLPDNVESGFLINKVNGKTRRTFCFIASPESTEKKGPAVVLVHGAGGNAYAEWACEFAKKGYTAISIDTNATCFEKSVAEARKDNPYAVRQDTGGFGGIDGKPRENWIYGSVAQIVSAASYLKSLKQVDETSVGVVGISWGGVLSLNALGADAGFAAGAIIYSGGFITEDVLGEQTGLFSDYAKKRAYETRFDPSAYAENVRVPVLMTAGLTDGAFSPVNRKRTYDLFNTKPEFAFLPYIFHDNESNFCNANVFAFLDKVLMKKENGARLCVEVSDGMLYVKTDKSVVCAEAYYCGEYEDMHKAEWKTEIIDLSTPCKKLPENARYVCVTAFLCNGTFISSDVFSV